jgi:hypothetical protein
VECVRWHTSPVSSSIAPLAGGGRFGDCFTFGDWRLVEERGREEEGEAEEEDVAFFEFFDFRTTGLKDASDASDVSFDPVMLPRACGTSETIFEEKEEEEEENDDDDDDDDDDADGCDNNFFFFFSCSFSSSELAVASTMVLTFVTAGVWWRRAKGAFDFFEF